MPSSFAPHRGGVETVGEQLARGMVTLGHDPLVITNRWPKDLARSQDVGGIPVTREVFRVPEPTPRQLLGWMATGRLTERRLVRRVRQHRCDLLNIHCVSSNAGYALAIARELRLPIVMSLHGELSGDASSVYSRSSWLRHRWHELADLATLITAPSQHTLAEAEFFYGQRFGDRGRVIPNGIDLTVFTPSSAPTPRTGVLAVGRLVGVKGFDLLLDAWSRVSPRQRREHHLSVVGDGPDEMLLRAAITRLGLNEHVTLLGGRSTTEVAGLMQEAVVVVVPSRQEAFGLVALEAAAAGCRVIGTRVGGLPEVINLVNGLLVDPGDAPELARAIEESLTRRPSGRSRCADPAWGWPLVIDSYLSAFCEALGSVA